MVRGCHERMKDIKNIFFIHLSKETKQVLVSTYERFVKVYRQTLQEKIIEI